VRGLRPWAPDRWWLVAALALSWALRLPPAWQNRFHPDEALYAFWGLLIGSGRDPWLSGVPVYKPPVVPYLVAGSQVLLGNSEFAARYVGLVSGMLVVALSAALGHALFREHRVSILAGFLVAFSPFAILFSGTAFPDTLMVALGLGACLAAVRGNGGWAGVLAGLSFASKQTGLVWAPLALFLGLIFAADGLTFSLRALAGFVLPVGLAAAWDRVRIGQGGVGFWNLGVTGFGGLRLIWPQELWERLRGWWGILRYLFVSPVINGFLMVSVLVLAVRGFVKGRFDRGALIDLVLVTFLLAYLFFHWLLAFPIWDRYMLPLVPVMALLLARFSDCLLGLLPRWKGLSRKALGAVPAVVLLACLARPGLSAARSLYPVGGDRAVYDGIDEVTAFLRDRPEGTVIYQHWLGWQYAYYLFDAQLFTAYWPTPDWLARDVQAFGQGEDERYITFPSWESKYRVADALRKVGYKLKPVLTTTRRDGTRSFTVYRILPLL